MWLKGVLVILFFAEIGWAQSSISREKSIDLQVTDQYVRSEISFGADMVQLQTPSVSLSGFGFTVGYQYTLQDELAVKTHVMQAFSTSSGGGSLFTSFGAGLLYALKGHFGSGESEISNSGASIIRIRKQAASIWSVGAGFEQLFLSGNEAVYPAPGVSLSSSYAMTLWNTRCIFGLRFGQYKNNEKSITGTMLNVTLPIDL